MCPHIKQKSPIRFWIELVNIWLYEWLLHIFNLYATQPIARLIRTGINKRHIEMCRLKDMFRYV
jgi:hypothetical protein